MPVSTCLKGGTSELERPLLTLKFQGDELHICPQCLPILIHRPHALTEKLPGFQTSEYLTSQDD